MILPLLVVIKLGQIVIWFLYLSSYRNISLFNFFEELLL